jgi:hypothetical protein
MTTQNEQARLDAPSAPPIDPRGVYRKVIASAWAPDGIAIAFECGHGTIYAPHFQPPKAGEERRCFRCGEEARAALSQSGGER